MKTEKSLPVAVKKCSSQEARFAFEVVRLVNPAEAYHVAYPGAGWVTCRNRSKMLLKRPQVASEVERLMGVYAEAVGIPREVLIREAAKVAFANVGDVADWDANGVTLVAKGELSREQTAAIKSVKMTENGPVVEMHSKQAAQEFIAKLLGYVTDKVAVEVNHRIDLTERARVSLEQMRERRAIQAQSEVVA